MLKEYLEKNYGYNEPIFINEIRLDGINDNALRQYFKRMLKSGDLARFDTGIYYLPKASRLLKKSYLDPMKVIIRKYIQSTTEVYGYFTGATFANQIGLTTQMPAILEIITSKEATKGRNVTVGSQNVRLKRPTVTITSENVGYSPREVSIFHTILDEYLAGESFRQPKWVVFTLWKNTNSSPGSD